jgi:hypothetical protein
MKLSVLLTGVISLAAMGFVPSEVVEASSFKEQRVDRDRFAVMAAPYRHGYNLVVVEQIPGQRKCWLETGSYPTVIEPLFLNFDFTNSCKRSSDSNSYSIRFNGRDYGMDYLTDIVKQDGELHLIGVPRDSNKPQLHLGRTYGFKTGSLKIILDPQWRLTKRVYGNNTTEHIYLSNSPESSTQLISQTAKPLTPTYQPPNNIPVSNVAPIAQPIAPSYPVPIPNNYPQLYQQPVYPLQALPQQPVVNYQPVYPVQALPQQPVVNYQPVYPVQALPQQSVVNHR